MRTLTATVISLIHSYSHRSDSRSFKGLSQNAKYHRLGNSSYDALFTLYIIAVPSLSLLS